MAEPSPYPGTRTSQGRTTNGDVYVNPSGGLVGIDLSGTWTATVFFEATEDWNNWYTVNAVDPTVGTTANNTNTIGHWVALVGNAVGFRCRVGSITGGTVQIDLYGGSGPPPYQPVVINALPPQTSLGGSSSGLTGSGQANGTACNGCASATFYVSGTWVGDLEFEVTNDGVHYVPANAVRMDTQPLTGRDIVTHTTTNGTFLVQCGGWTQVQAKLIAYTSGTCTVATLAGTGDGPVYVVAQNRGRNVRCVGMASGFRVVGNNNTPHTLLTLENGSSSPVLVAVRDFDLYVDATAAQGAIFQAKLSRSTSAPTGGTTLTKVTTDSSLSSDSNVTVRSGASADGTDTGITATAGTTMYQTLLTRPHTIVGWFAQMPHNLDPPGLGLHDPIVLRAGEYLILQVVTGSGANNVSTISYVPSVVWEEFTYYV